MLNADRLPFIAHACAEQRRFAPRNCALSGKCRASNLLGTEQWRDRGDIGRGFRRERMACGEVLFIPRHGATLAIALANELVRIAWAVLARGRND